MAEDTSRASWRRLQPSLRETHWKLFNWMANEPNKRWAMPCTGDELTVMIRTAGVYTMAWKRLKEMARLGLLVELPPRICRSHAAKRAIALAAKNKPPEVPTATAKGWGFPRVFPTLIELAIRYAHMREVATATKAINAWVQENPEQLKRALLHVNAPGAVVAAAQRLVDDKAQYPELYTQGDVDARR